jgi:hypothetical protein
MDLMTKRDTSTGFAATRMLERPARVAWKTLAVEPGSGGPQNALGRAFRRCEDSMIKRDLIRNVTHSTRRHGPEEAAVLQSIDGFAFDEQDPQGILRVEILKDGTCVASGRADKFRHDLLLENVGDGYHCFEIPLPGHIGLDEDVVVRIINDTTGEWIDHSCVPIVHENVPRVAEKIMDDFM